MSARSSGGDSTSAWSSRSSTHERNAARFTTGSATTTPPSAPPLDHRLVAELVDHPAGPRRVDQDAGVDGLVLAVGQRVAAHVVGGVDAGRGREARRRAPSSALALDAVDPERAGGVAVAVVADDVPVAEAQHHAVGVEVAGVAPVGERRPAACAAHRVEERRRAPGVTSSSASAAVGALAARGRRACARPSRPASPSRRTAVTATCSAASSASVELELGEVVVVGVDPVRLFGAEPVDASRPRSGCRARAASPCRARTAAGARARSSG